MRPFSRRSIACWVAWLPAALVAAGELPCGAKLNVDTQAAELGTQVRVTLGIAAPREVVWNAITDYAHATQFIHHLQHSSAETLGVNHLRVQQTGRVGKGPFTTLVHTLYEVRLQPDQYQLEAELVGGDLRHMRMSSRLQANVTDAYTTLQYAATIDPGNWVPLWLAEPVLRQSAQESFQDLALEIAKRSPTCPKGF